jgi:hypothetical protein
VTNSPIPNFARVDDTLWRGARPDDAGVAWLVAQDIRTIISLELLHGDPASHGVTCVALPDWEALPLIAPPYEDKHIHAFLAAVRSAARPIYVHCRDGQNRTGVAVAAYRLVEKGEPLDAVLIDMASFHGAWFEVDASFIRTVSDRIAEFR